MPGHVGTDIARKADSEVDPATGEWRLKPLTAERLAGILQRFPELAQAVEGKSGAEAAAVVDHARQAMGQGFKDGGLTAAEAAGLIIRGVLEKRWRILIGAGLHNMDYHLKRWP